MEKRALIFGISGQDGSYLARFLLTKGYRVVGSSRDAQMCSFSNLVRLKIRDQVEVESASLNDFRSVLQVLKKVRPDEVYNLAGQSSVGLSFEQPVESFESISIGTLNLLEAIRFLEARIKIYNAGSSECFGNTDGRPADELTPFRPRSPYAVAKAAAFWQMANYREAYGLFASSGLLFNHESPLRPQRFVTRKIVNAACRIAEGSKEKLELGNISVERDWGWAPEYVEAMWLMLQQEDPDDYVIATGETNRLEDFVDNVFKVLGLNWQDHVKISREFFRPTDILAVSANPDKAARKLRWKAKYKMCDVARMMVEAEKRHGEERCE
ncbi:MAG: GDP-mannose 4,6-dehydratase [Desulfobacteraceae bacterium]|nr:GDP-mannose 4,6-dehydratase [Desulfobacterales bacterium]MBL6966982.1 GDP-mannose 4,6-dehydratase [Desulfobacteraceae bacterium]MBL7173997.1 GDP-mannose 4,6-dehydratase [Desulfobacteraceae bacterium]